MSALAGPLICHVSCQQIHHGWYPAAALADNVIQFYGINKLNLMFSKHVVKFIRVVFTMAIRLKH